ncbi:MAG: hypothetical protein IKL47_02950 [Clostridia bacterium]|nr:hypothetical protein [Clostridia bacterium]
MKHKISDYFPVGYNVRKVRNSIIAGYILPVVSSAIIFFSNFFYNYNSLFQYNIAAGEREIIQGARMVSFEYLREHIFDIFIVFVFYLIIVAVYNFIYHYQGSKSIYTMKRLPSKTELYRRCLTVPAFFLLLGFITALMLNFVYYIFYIMTVPYECLAPSWNTMWRF